MNKYLGTRILISKEVKDDLPDFLTREIGRFRLYGKTNPVNLYELICSMDHADGARQHFIALFSEALSAFRAREWDRAEQLFQEYLNLSEEDGAARHYLRECAKCREYPPDEDWDGMVCFEKK